MHIFFFISLSLSLKSSEIKLLFKEENSVLHHVSHKLHTSKQMWLTALLPIYNKICKVIPNFFKAIIRYKTLILHADFYFLQKFRQGYTNVLFSPFFHDKNYTWSSSSSSSSKVKALHLELFQYSSSSTFILLICKIKIIILIAIAM